MNIVETCTEKFIIYLDRINKFSSEIEDENWESLTITQLPLEILQSIIKYLSAKDIIKLSMVSKQFYLQITSNDIITKSRVKNILESIVLQVSGNEQINRLTKIFNEIDKQLCSNDTIQYNKLSRFLNQIDTNLYSNDSQLYPKDSKIDNYQKFFNHYPIIMYWQSLLNPIKYCANLPKDNFVALIENLETQNYTEVAKIMKNSVWFTLKNSKNWLIKITFKISDSIIWKELILSIKICSVVLCPNNTCVEVYHEFTVKENKNHYSLKVNDIESIYLVLPKNKLLKKIFANTKGIKNKAYKSIDLHYDISEFETEHWTLLYEFILKMIYYKFKEPTSKFFQSKYESIKNKKNEQVPKFYYGDYKHVKNDKIKQVYNDLNLITIQLSKILQKFINCGTYLQYNKIKDCNHMFSDDFEDDNYCWICGLLEPCPYH